MCRTDSATLIDLHLKRLGYQTAIREGRIDLIGPPRLTRQFTSWFRTTARSPIHRRAPGAGW